MQKQGRYLILIAALFILEDLVILNLLYVFMLCVFDLQFDGEYQIVFILVNLGYLLSFAVIRVDFNDVKQLHVPHLARRNFYKLLIAALILVACLFFLKISSSISRFFILSFFPAACLLMLPCQWITRKALTFVIKKTISRGVILGVGLIGEKVLNEMLYNIYNGVVIVGLFDDDPAKQTGNVLGNVEQAKEFILKNDVTHVFCTLPLSAEEKIRDFIKFSESNVINFHIVPAIGYYYTGNQPIVEHIGKMPVFVLRNIPLSYVHNAAIKRGVDILVSTIVIAVLFPFIFPVLSILVKLSSPGPVFFKQQRTGKQGKIFTCYKFRTMRSNGDAHVKQATADDCRKTKLGNFLRKTSLDELPQFFNVWIGNMSIVGPRPHMLLHTSEYSPRVDKYMVRHFVKPGITGLAQISGYRGETREIELMEKRIITDIRYIENWSLAMDLKIMAKTALMIIAGDDKAY
jgi:putative colanic acid biosynthesis UDP-glucose lipid carrier transferase